MGTGGENPPGGRQLLMTGGLGLVALKFPATSLSSSSSQTTTTTTTTMRSSSSLLSSRRVERKNFQGGVICAKVAVDERAVFGVGATSEVLVRALWLVRLLVGSKTCQFEWFRVHGVGGVAVLQFSGFSHIKSGIERMVGVNPLKSAGSKSGGRSTHRVLGK